MRCQPLAMPGVAASCRRASSGGRWACQRVIAAARVRASASVSTKYRASHPGATIPGCSDAEIPAGQLLLGDEGRHAVDAEAVVDLPARAARLAELQAGVAELEDVADPNLRFVERRAGNVFAQAAGQQLPGSFRKLFGKARVVGCRIEMDGLFRPAVNTAVGLLVAGKAFETELQGRAHRVLVHAGRPAAFRQRGDGADEEGDA